MERRRRIRWNGRNLMRQKNNSNATEFVAETVSVDFASAQKKFADRLPREALILDFGCGSGRDTKYFLEKGYTTFD